ncbi:MAG: glucokinase, partial [Acidobacteriota bacterium]
TLVDECGDRIFQRRKALARQARTIERACFGIAGPIRHGRCETTNLPWVIDSREVATRLGLDSAPLLNDLEAAAWGLDVLGPNGLRTLHAGHEDASGNRALLAPGTGLGEAAMFWDGRRHHAIATEGGHADFGPADEQQVALWRFMTRRHGHVSWERIASGPGLVALYEFFLDQHGEERPPWLDEAEGGAAAAITSRAHDERFPLCRETVDLFFALLGAEAGNLALKTMAHGGVYIAGGIVPKLLTELMESSFLDAFIAKGRFRPLLESMPVRVVIDDRVALWGAAACAFELAVHERLEPAAVTFGG